VVKLCTLLYTPEFLHFKMLISALIVSQDPNNYADAPTEGIRRVLEIVMGEKIPRGQVLDTRKIGKRARYEFHSSMPD
jgi:hypothetical protein